MNTPGRRIATVLTAGLLAAGTLGLAANVASADSATPTEHFDVVFANGTATAILSGPITAPATTVGHDSYDLVKAEGGTFRLNHPNSQEHFTFHYDKATCYATEHTIGRYSISNGTGKFAGISGHGSYSGYGHAILARTKSGACDLEGQPAAEIFQIWGHGPISL